MENENIKQNQPEIDPITNDELVPDHEFDGIRELANDPPFWLNILFAVTVLFAYTYLMNYHFFKHSPSQEEEYANEIAKIEGPKPDKFALPGTGSEEVVVEEPTVLELLTDEASLIEGKAVYDMHCKICHLELGEGQTGPNLTDEYWIHGGSFEDIVHTINEGVIVKGMIAWKNQIPESEIVQVASYIVALQGTNPPNAKAPEGELYIPEN